MPSDRSLELQTAVALQRQRHRTTAWFDRWNVVQGIVMQAAGSPTDIKHGMGDGVIPDGFSVISATGPVFTAPGKVWTDKVAYIQTDASNVRADVVFFTLRKDS